MLLVSIFGQWTGNSILGLLLGAVLDKAGISDQVSQTNLNLGISCSQLVAAVVGASIVDIVGRRPLFIVANGVLALLWLGLTIVTSIHAESGSAVTSRAILALIWLFLIVFAVGITPLQVLYPVEVLSFQMRAKGLALSSLSVSAADLLNQFGWPVALDRIGWKLYIILFFWCSFQAWIAHLFMPETRECTVRKSRRIIQACELIILNSLRSSM